MEEKLKRIYDLYDKVASCKRSDIEAGVGLLLEVINAELELFNNLFGRSNTMRSGVIAALMESHLEAMKGAGLYRAESIANLKCALGSVCAVSKKRSDVNG